MIYGPEIEALKRDLFPKTVTYNMNLEEKQMFLEKMKKRYSHYNFGSSNINSQIKEILHTYFITSDQREALIREFRGKGPDNWDAYYQKVFKK